MQLLVTSHLSEFVKWGGLNPKDLGWGDCSLCQVAEEQLWSSASW